MPLAENDVRLEVYRRFIADGRSPAVAELARSLAAPREEIAAALQALHESRALVLQPSGEILMANPLSAVPTPYVVRVSSSPHVFFGNCIWDSFGVVAMLGGSGTVETTCGDCGEAMSIAVSGYQLATPASQRGLCHFALPARRWWEDIVFN